MGSFSVLGFNRHFFFFFWKRRVRKGKKSNWLRCGTEQTVENCVCLLLLASSGRAQPLLKEEGFNQQNLWPSLSFYSSLLASLPAASAASPNYKKKKKGDHLLLFLPCLRFSARHPKRWGHLIKVTTISSFQKGLCSPLKIPPLFKVHPVTTWSRAHPYQTNKGKLCCAEKKKRKKNQQHMMHPHQPNPDRLNIPA